ncbi:MAG: tRNA (N(6)-L-threonylcarbamoyladenosine(37)-C(2))-methylthiotransferase MtaB [Tissierellia bacterium]|nr:tRNA (N(6)-L-threonylcarbamoyladenosine(37)-C(2))-methylthiotransferase MtaB [Tissierellia bacterium]
MKVSIMTLGCKVNQYESEAMGELFVKNGHELVEDEVADIYLINTCTVTGLSDRKSRQFISKAKSENKDSIIAVVGCYSQISPDEIEKLGGIDIILGTTERYRIVELCENAIDDKKTINLVKELKPGKSFEPLNIKDNKDKTRSYIKIQEGCNQFCSYCIIPYARGPITSRDKSDIIEEATKLAENGYKEVVLTGIHVASYGLDKRVPNALIDIIEAVSHIEGIQRIRMSSIEPRIIDRKLLDRLSKIEKFCDHFHLSLQSGSDTVLKRMNRKYNIDTYKEKIELIREYYPYAGITTDIIVGFPGESDEEFSDTLKAVNDIGFSRVHSFRYSPRRGTPAAKFKDQIKGDIKKERSKKLNELTDKKADDFMKYMIGKEVSVLFENSENGLCSGYSTNYLKVMVEGKSNLEGSIKNVIILDKTNEFLIGKLIY